MSSDIQWVVLELTAKAEGEDPDVIVASIRHHIRDAEVFIPASVVQRGAIREFRYLVDGYAFIRHCHPDGHYLRLEDTKFVQSPLYKPTENRREKRLATVPEHQIQTLRAQIIVEVEQGIEVGDSVVITSGPYKNIRATVREEIEEQNSVVVFIHLRSTERLVTLPRAFLRLESKSLLPVYREKLRELGRWVAIVQVLVKSPSLDIGQLKRRYEALVRLDRWLQRTVEICRWLNVVCSSLDVAPLQKRHAEYQRLVRFERATQQRQGIGVVRKEPKLNLVVDGTQLFIRCSEVPGLSGLTDREGRKTGGVVGFLRSLAAYRKRFPHGSIYICWDGSSARRKRIYAGYKGNRVSRAEEPSFGWGWLREVLPMLGVRQAFNVDEEADDVMATLVRGPLERDLNVMVTSDRDLLQVVSESTHQLCPAVGGKEKLYDPEAIVAEYGVSPSGLVQLRALSGDASDNLAGVPGFGLKTAQRVLKPYGLVSALYRSNLAGLTKLQVKNLRASAKQVALNVELMTLRDVPVTYIEPNLDQDGAKARLAGLGIRSGGVLAAFFGMPSHAEAVADVSL